MGIQWKRVVKNGYLLQMRRAGRLIPHYHALEAHSSPLNAGLARSRLKCEAKSKLLLSRSPARQAAARARAQLDRGAVWQAFQGARHAPAAAAPPPGRRTPTPGFSKIQIPEPVSQQTLDFQPERLLNNPGQAGAI